MRSSCERVSSRPSAIRAATARVGLLSPRSTCESVAAPTPERSASSRSDSPIASRSAFTLPPIATGSTTASSSSRARRRSVSRVSGGGDVILCSSGLPRSGTLAGVFGGLYGITDKCPLFDHYSSLLHVVLGVFIAAALGFGALIALKVIDLGGDPRSSPPTGSAA